MLTSITDFNPRPREEGDQLPFYLYHYLQYFNPRPREEGDPSLVYALVRRQHFNPRPREEGDPIVLCEVISTRISIHALVKRATYGRKWYYRLIDISIHALVKRATKNLRGDHRRPLYFNPRPREEGDR